MRGDEHPTNPHGIHLALREWTELLGSEHVADDAAALRQVETTTFASERRVRAILYPGNRDEVQACLRVANAHKVPLYPTSRGKQWGLGSRVPVRDDNVVLDLQRMNRIVDFDETLSYITVEPGVTFEQVDRYLRSRSSKLYLPTIGGTMHASVLGNTLERGHGRGMHRDRAEYATDFEVVLPSGELLRTGMGRFSNARNRRLHRWGVGPSVEGLFLQSNLGVVTQMTVWLSPLPGRSDGIAFHVSSTQLPEVAERLRAFSWKDNCQWVMNKNSDFVPDPAGPGIWEVIVYFFVEDEAASEREVDEAARLLEGLVPEISLYDAPRALEPTERRVMQIYDALGRTRPSDGADLDRDGCGIRWICPAVPFRADDIRDFTTGIDEIAGSIGLDPTVILFPTSARSFDAFIALVYDRDDAVQSEKTQSCYERLTRFFIEEGFTLYRLGIDDMSALPATDGAYDDLIAAVKDLVDPNGILAPGRYDFR